jgi:antitoxin (DNA-binding transcriptional repressor) of toxin-antitoxin stability system
MTSISIQEAGAALSELVDRLLPGEEILITDNDRPVAKITKAEEASPSRKLGTMAGSVLFMAPDFDAPLDDFREYMP